MDNKNIARIKSKSFAVRIVNLYRHLCDEKKAYVLSKQILRSGTSIGANLAEAEYAISDKDFLYQTEYNSINEDALALLKMLKATTKTLSTKLNSNI